MTQYFCIAENILSSTRIPPGIEDTDHTFQMTRRWPGLLIVTAVAAPAYEAVMDVDRVEERLEGGLANRVVDTRLCGGGFVADRSCVL